MLVYNPVGPSLPPDQRFLEADYRRKLWNRHGIEFTQLYTITSMPISRFPADLLKQGRYEDSMQTLVKAFNPHTPDGLLCRTMLPVDWIGNLYDSDFNQMLDLPLSTGRINIAKVDDGLPDRLLNLRIATGRHCFGRTAGCGSSCRGRLALVDDNSKGSE